MIDYSLENGLQLIRLKYGRKVTLEKCKEELQELIEALEKRIISQNNHLRKVDLRLKIRNETNKINNIGEWNGQNNYGKILMKCRNCLLNNTVPAIDYDLLRSKNIYIFNKPIEI